MKFLLEVDISEFGDDTAKELGRILRYWGGNLQHITFEPGQEQAIYDSAYREVGRLSVTDS
ncbi:MAG: hypothetical protein HOV83_22760 [Catenulispora sp.]|nr:hypothetical protein [Catenulispora sp.]